MNTAVNQFAEPGMYLWKQAPDREEKAGRRWGIIITTALTILLFLLLWLIRIVTPIPAIPPDPEPLAIEISLSEGYGGSDVPQGGGSFGNTGQPGAQPEEAAEQPQHNTSEASEGAVTNPNSEAPPASNATAAEQPSNDLLSAIANFNKNKGKATIKVGGQGSGDPSTYGMGDHSGNDIGNQDGGDHGDGGPGGGNSHCSRSIVSKPEIVNPTQEEGKVVVNVYVDRQGNVKKAEVNISGTTTVNSVLRATATQSAYKIKFNADPTCSETVVFPIDINFTLK